MGYAVPTTRESLESLRAPSLAINSRCRSAVEEFERLKSQGACQRLLAGGLTEIVGRSEFNGLCAELDHSVDPVLLEVYTLAKINAFFPPPRDKFQDEGQVLKRAITARIHDLLDERPELLHPNLLVAAEDGRARCLLGFLVHFKVNLDPLRLHKLAFAPGYVGDIVQAALQSGKDLGEPLMAAALNADAICLDSATALAISDALPLSNEPHEMHVLLLDCASALAAADAGASWQLESALGLLHALRERPDIQALEWPEVSDVLEANDLAWASSRDLHPVLRYVFAVTSQASSTDFKPRQEHSANGWPAQQLARGADALNACLPPEHRLELHALNGENLLKLMLLCPQAAAAGGMKMGSFWNLSPAERPHRNAWDLVLWAAGKRDAGGARVQLSFLDRHREDLVSWMRAENYSALRATMAENVMLDTIEVAGGYKPAEAAVAPAVPSGGIRVARRREKAL